MSAQGSSLARHAHRLQSLTGLPESVERAKRIKWPAVHSRSGTAPGWGSPRQAPGGEGWRGELQESGLAPLGTALGSHKHGEEARMPRPFLKPSLHLEGKHRHKDPLAFMQHSIWQKRGSFLFLRCTYRKDIWQEKATPRLHGCTSTRSPGRLLQRDLFQ